MKNCVFIHTNERQWIGALVSQYSLKRNSANPDAFDVRIIHVKDFPFLAEREGQSFLRGGTTRVWRMSDLQSFTPLRFMPPKLMGYQGRAVVIDPDIFAAADIFDLLSRDMQGKAILCRMRSGPKGLVDRCFASSVMLLDCARLTHWDVQKKFEAMFDFTQDYQPWICLKEEDRDTIDFFEAEWNDFDKFTLDTRMLHTTRRKTQPWKTGLPTDWRPAERFRLFPPAAWVMIARRKLFGEYAFLGNYKQHPDQNQENFFFGLLKECLAEGKITEEFLREEMAQNHVRHDALEVLQRTPDLPPAPAHPLSAVLRAA